MAYVWLAMMLVWLGAIVGAVWWIWPHVQAMELTHELFIGLFWLLTGVAAWVVALRFGVPRYWRR